MVSPLSLKKALRADAGMRLAIVGAGGKTTLMFRLARDFSSPVIVTTSTHLAIEQAKLADHHHIIASQSQLQEVFTPPLDCVNLFTGLQDNEGRLAGLPGDLLEILAQCADRMEIPLIIEADGSRLHPLKGPADHEPAIPAWARQVAVVAGLGGLMQPLNSAQVHRPEIFAELSGCKLGDPVTAETIIKVLLSKGGGLKNIPTGASRYVVLNQADDDQRLSTGGKMANELLSGYDSVLIARLTDPVEPVKAVYSPVAGIILAAGGSSRMAGASKQVLEWEGEPFVRIIARTALQAGLNPVVVVTGADAELVFPALRDIDVKVVHNHNWQEGQSSSLQAGIRVLPKNVGGAIFLLADMPQVDAFLLKALIEEYQRGMGPIIAPMVDGTRANPVLFDRVTFEKIGELRGDTGGRALFSQFPVTYLPWLDPLLLMDVDTIDDFHHLKEAYASHFPNQQS